MKPLILLLLITACAPAPLPIVVYEEIEASTIIDETLYLPLVFTNTNPCIDIEGQVTLRYIDDFLRVEGPFTVIDCVQHSEDWPTELQYDEMVNIEGTNFLHFGIAKQGEQWLNVLIWRGPQKPYSLNLILVEDE